ncbi:MAG: regulatory iron-sulfur-containing complex subunit RicT [Bacteroidales bacterium]
MSKCGQNGRGCSSLMTASNEITFCENTGCYKLDTYNYLKDIPEDYQQCDIVEVRFKNTRKGYYKTNNTLKLKVGDIVAVESSPGHDIGIVSLTGFLVKEQTKKSNVKLDENDLKKIYRKAKPTDIDKWRAAITAEHTTMIESRKIAVSLNLDMKIGDVEYQGDGTKAIFYYIADDRVDFRELIKKLAERFHIRIEMKQIGARQEAGRIGGIGACGRELCCSTCISNFVSVTTNSARFQGVSLNPQKLAGQCGKLKCCLNYEVDAYLDAQEDFPDTDLPLQTEAGPAYHQKTDVFKRLMWFSYDLHTPMNIACLSVEKVKEIIELNKKGIKVKKLESVENVDVKSMLEYVNVGSEESLTRFEDKISETPRKANKQIHIKRRRR